MSTQLTAAVPCDIHDLALADRGKRRIEWAFQSMCVLQEVRKHLIKTQPFAKLRIAACLNVTAETANLMITLRDGGASLALCSANPFSTQDDVAASLVKDYGIPVFAFRAETAAESTAHRDAVLDSRPHLTMDDGCDLIRALHHRRPELLDGMIGATEDTTTGAARLRSFANSGKLRFPVICLNESVSKQLFDNRLGTGQSTLDAITRCTNVLLAGLKVVVIGFGPAGRGIAQRARGLGANVIVTEIDPLRALDALMDGYRVSSLAEAVAVGDLIITVTGNRNVLTREHFERLKNGAILCNAGHSHVEIDKEALAQSALSRRAVREFVEEFALRDGRRVYLLADGRLINLAAAEGHPAPVMDMAFAIQVVSAEYLVKNRASLQNAIYPVPLDVDRQVAKQKLESVGVKIDRLTVEQERYLAGWSGDE